MIKIIIRKFIVLSMLMIACVVTLLVLFIDSDVLIMIDMPKDRPMHSLVFFFLIFLLIIFVGSWLLSKVAMRPIKATWQKQLDFTADASHELRTPITVIQTNLELVMERPEESVQSQMRWLQNIKIENQRMARLVEDLLTLSRADTNQQVLAKESFMLDELCREALASFEPLAKAKNIALEATLEEPTIFYGDLKRMKQLVMILLDNALHYTSTGAVKILLSQNEKELTLTVSDTGSGIETKHLDKIFERFYRVSDTRKLHPEGSGLGLPIAKWIAQEHGGTIHATSTDMGTNFIVRLKK